MRKHSIRAIASRFQCKHTISVCLYAFPSFISASSKSQYPLATSVRIKATILRTFNHTSTMKFAAILFALTSITATAVASSPNPSNTIIRINTSPRTAITKSRVTTTLAKKASLSNIVDKHIDIRDPVATEEAHDALHYFSNTIRDASTDAVKTRSGMRGMSRRSRTAKRAQEAQYQSTDLPARTDDEPLGRRNGMGKARRQRARGSQQQRRQPKFLSQ